ncbi:response regulator transcription factor [Microbispora triticiradicis]|uniref:Helix-turn-helix transcriptional regulator n=2 Tax=Microbispora TaxID=2005 RepID=A0ABY3LS94_9ACTN|nr:MULTISPECIES: helix-turn-helix transcriptional regulator [Microbispora]TLP62481.1 helix-turn-helix transcriptional regulator [Microbispora fusca]TYB52012.1 helix-turn-helix transcriptional regulator [Microbispora tritici]
MFAPPDRSPGSAIDSGTARRRHARLGPRRAAGPALSGCTTCGSQDVRGCVSIGNDALPSPIAAALLLAPSLTAREASVFELLGLGYDNRSIARMLSISERTAKRHITAILAKLRLESRLQAGLTAMLVSLTTQTDLARQTRA